MRADASIAALDLSRIRTNLREYVSCTWGSLRSVAPYCPAHCAQCCVWPRRRRHGTGYSALTSIPYTGGTKYSFWFQLNIPAQTYNVYVTPEGGSQVQIGANYAFRLSAPTLNNLTYHAETGSDHICSFNLPLGGN